MSKQYTTTDEFGTFYYKDLGKKKLHRTDGPAIEYIDGHQEWYVNDERHRLDGPAVIYEDGSSEWFVNGEFIFETDWSGDIMGRM